MASKRIGIVGLGLIGGSLALDLQFLGWEVHGLVNRKVTAEKAKERGLAQVISTNPDVIANCDVVIIALPLSNLLNPSSDLIAALPRNAVITDVGSVKKPVLEIWGNLHPRFVAGHPMAGTEKAGVEAGEKELFKHRPWVLTPVKDTDQDALETVSQIVISLKSKLIISNPTTHDQAVALISHLPVIISSSLLKTLQNEPDHSIKELAQQLASSGFIDTTRVGGGNPELGTSMTSENHEFVKKALKSYLLNLQEFEEIINDKNWQELLIQLQNTQTNRANILKTNHST